MTGSLSRAQPQDNKKTHRTELTRVYCSDPRPVRLSICHCDQWERLSRLSPSRASPLSNCWRVANVGIPAWSGTSPLRSTRHHCCYCRAHCCDCRLIVGLSLRVEVGFTEPNPRYYQFLAYYFQENFATLSSETVQRLSHTSASL